jgi:cell shape-determining protein MreD
MSEEIKNTENTREENEQVQENLQEKRELKTSEKKGLNIADLLLTAILLAAGAVLKFFVGSIINIGGMKPNFIIAMYCMVIVLIRPKVIYAAIVGLLAGAICQFFPGTPYLNFASELAGAIAMGLLIKMNFKFGKYDPVPALATFLSTVVSGGLYTILLIFVIHADKSTLVAYIPIVLCTALFNSVIVQILYLPLKKALKK